mmetsp:Transcript_4505/g.15826  ORF Transcript_4505/g.15826 Transcript_4505/m.15826 type:complete len:213 (+) Transcript_4505:147-785(+)|eukprot:CAMPEP_0114616748 /NCGR_PEP_ID=MMETSP0168-20121206/6846_1 /TAXON_ID=95228 ORGANISM="Vannella sp., Strain DIVA3 517/6/12" /NCGR_SAMPLE_ID=MMETSP0168 /ASSEMBLY_ACC=CAM_ASM_000044 /LENGTH=212 /DNA_ID=CAMNT_0001827871 /DNA_START=62 /DNA_END=700 /DNA_ORIENTATION=-
MAPPKITYFPARGRAELARLVLAAAGVEWVEEAVSAETLPALKESGKLAFGQVPLYEDDDVSLVQSMTIARYLARKHDLYGDLQQGAIADMLIDGYGDLLNKLIPNIFPAPNWPALRKLKEEVAPVFAKQFEAVLAQNNGGNEYAAGSSFSFADLVLFSITESLLFDLGLVSAADYPLLEAHYKSTKAHENLTKYLESDKRFPPRKLEIPPE